MAQWTSVCTHSHTEYGYSSACKVVQYAVGGSPARPCVHVAMVPLYSAGSPNVTKLRTLAIQHPQAISVRVYDSASEDNMRGVVEDITNQAGDSGVNLVYTCPDWCEESPESGLVDVTEEILKRTFHENCVVPTFLSKLFYPGLQTASKANCMQPINRRRAALIHLIGESGTLGDYFEGTRGRMYGYSASLAAMIMSMKTMSYELEKRQDGILVMGVVTPSPHCSRDYDVIKTRDDVSKVVHSASEREHGRCMHCEGADVSY